MSRLRLKLPRTRRPFSNLDFFLRDDWAMVHFFVHKEQSRTRFFVVVQYAGADGRGAFPTRQEREMYVDGAALRHIEYRFRQNLSVINHYKQVVNIFPNSGDKILVEFFRLQDGNISFVGPLRDGRRLCLHAAALRLVGSGYEKGGDEAVLLEVVEKYSRQFRRTEKCEPDVFRIHADMVRCFKRNAIGGGDEAREHPRDRVSLADRH